MSYSIITPATLKALTVQEVKDYLRVDSSDEDTLLGVLIDAATQIGEHVCTTEGRVWAEEFGGRYGFSLPCRRCGGDEFCEFVFARKTHRA